MQNDIALYHGDCKELMKQMPEGSIDLILTDPPYNISRQNNFRTMGRSGLDFGEWDKDFNLTDWIDETKRIVSKNGSMIIFNAWKNIGEIASYAEAVGFEIKDFLRWEKSNPMPRNRDRRYITDFEVAVWLVKKGAKWTFNRQSPTYQRPLFKIPVVSANERIHPTQKPVDLMQEIIQIHTNAGNIVFDPFLGSGSTAIACMRTGRRFIGMELDKHYFEVAVNRVESERKLAFCV